ncbi:MAG: hypothetical protein ACLVBS_11035 [Agathobacter rectalis]
MPKLTVLITGCSKHSKEIVDALTQNDDGVEVDVVAVNMDKNKLLRHGTRYQYVAPPITDEGYIPFLKRVCKETNTNIIIPYITAELELMAKHKQEFEEIGCMCPSVLISGAANFPVRKKERQVAAWDKNQEYYKYCDKILSQLKRLMTCSEVIKCDDENAIEALKEKIEAKEESQERMKEVNKYWRKNGTMTGCSFLTDEQIEKINRSMAEDTWRLSGVPFGSYHLQNNLANIKRLKGRLEELQNAKEKGSSEADYGEFKVIENTDIMRIQIMFDGKPEEAVRNVLKANGFRWAPSQEAWQRQLTTNGKYALKRVLEALQTEKEGA